MKWGEYDEWRQGNSQLSYYKMMLDDATERPARDAERKKVVHADEFPWENSPHGLLKHLVNEAMDTRCETVDAYMQIIPPGSRSGKHRQLAEQAVYIVEGRGYDIHVDCDLTVVDNERYGWKPQELERRFEWEAGDLVYIPPNTISQHFNPDPHNVARVIVVTNRVYKMSGLNDLEQLEAAPEYDPKEQLTADLMERYLKNAKA